MDKCSECGSEELRLGITNITSGATVYPIYCADCGEVFAKYVKKIIAQEYEKENGPLKYVKTRTAKYIEKKQIQIKCEVCDANEGELHHWAPQYLFQDADNWPTSYLCRACHRKWHDLVTPNMSIKKMTPHRETPDFPSWQHDTLAKFATECYTRLQDEMAANEQLRLDVKDAMKLAHKQILEDNAA